MHALGEPLRFRLARIIAEAPGEICLAELVDIVRRPQYAVSRAMGILLRAGFVEELRRHRLRYWRIVDDPYNQRLLAALQSVPVEDSAWIHDSERLSWRLDLRQGGRCVVTYTAGYAPVEYRLKEDEMSETEKRKILFICVHNSARSQMAEEYLKLAASDLFDVESAGIEPGTLNPYVVKVLAEDGIDIAGKQTQSVFDLYTSGRTYTYVITVCSREAEERCPVFPGPVRRLSWPFPDPSRFTGTDDEILAQVRGVRDTVKAAVTDFVETYRAQHTNLETT